MSLKNSLYQMYIVKLNIIKKAAQIISY